MMMLSHQGTTQLVYLFGTIGTMTFLLAKSIQLWLYLEILEAYPKHSASLA